MRAADWVIGVGATERQGSGISRLRAEEIRGTKIRDPFRSRHGCVLPSRTGRRVIFPGDVCSIRRCEAPALEIDRCDRRKDEFREL